MYDMNGIYDKFTNRKFKQKLHKCDITDDKLETLRRIDAGRRSSYLKVNVDSKLSKTDKLQGVKFSDTKFSFNLISFSSRSTWLS